MSLNSLDDRGAFPRCPECGGRVELAARPGRFREYVRGVHLEIPNDCGIPTCTKCGEESMSLEFSKELDRRLADVLRERLKSYVQRIQRNYVGTSQLEIEQALRVTPSYLSHVLGGRKVPSGALVEMLALFAEVPGAFEHALPNKRAQPTLLEVAPTLVHTEVVWMYYEAKSFAGTPTEASPKTSRRWPTHPSYRSKFADQAPAESCVGYA